MRLSSMWSVVAHSMRVAAVCGLAALALPAWAGTPLGVWKTIDDDTGKPRSYVRIYEKDGKLYGVIEELIREPDEDQDPICDECPESMRKADGTMPKINGLTVLTGMVQNGEEWSSGHILDPGNGKSYSCKIWLEDDNKLGVRGYWGPLYRTQYWYRKDAK